MEAKEKTVVFKCPKCNEKLTMKVNLGELDFHGGIASITVLHGDPPHTAVVYLDMNGEVRGVEVPELTLVVGEETKEGRDIDISKVITINPQDIYKTFGPELLSLITLYSIADRPVYFVIPEGKEGLIKIINDLAEIMNNDIKVVKNKILNSRGFSIIDSKFYLVNEKEILKSLVYYAATGKIKQHDVKSKIFVKFIKKYFTKRGKIGEAIMQIRYYASLVNAAYEKLKTISPFPIKSLQYYLNLPSKEMEFIIEALKLKGAEIIDQKITLKK
ncbi:MAG: hypothetical protein ACP6IP_10250 [Candidatus Njordarchaeia archaeon]